MSIQLFSKPVSWRAVAVLLLAMLVLTYSTWLTVTLFLLPTDGIAGIIMADGVMVEQTWPDEAVLRPGDLVVGLNGHEIATHIFDPAPWRSLFDQDVSPTYTVLRNGQRLDLQPVWRRATIGWFVSRTLSFIVLGGIFVLSGILIAWRRGDNLAARLMALALILEGFNLFNNVEFTTSLNSALLFAWFSIPLDLLSFGLVFSALFHCFAFFPEPKSLGRRMGGWLGLIHLLNPLVGAIGGMLFGGPTPLAIRAAALNSLYVISGLELLGTIGHIAHTYLTTHTPGTRNQIRWLIWGLVVGVSPWLIFYNLAFVLTGRPLLPLPVLILPLTFIPLSLFFSIARYGLMKIDTLINRSLVYGALTIVLIAVNLLVATLLGGVLSGRGIGQTEITTLLISTLITILLIGGVRDRLQRWIDRLFYRERLNFENLLKNMGERLSTTIVFDNLVMLLTEFVPASLKLKSAFLLLPAGDDAHAPGSFGWVSYPEGGPGWTADNPLVRHLQNTLRPLSVSQFRHPTPELAQELDALAAAGIEICLPLRRNERLIGVYALAARPAGELYDEHELETLALLSHQIAAALENTRLYREVEVYSRTLESQVEARTAELRMANKKLADTAWDLAEQRARLDAVLQNIADGLVVTDLEERIVLTNPVFEQIVGAEGSTLKGMPLQKAFSGEGLSEVVQQVRTQALIAYTHEVTSWTGRVYQASASALTRGRVVIGVVTVLRDITREVEVDRMKTNFISTVSHELRTPLTSVLGFAKLIQRSFEEHIIPKIAADDLRGQHAVERISRNLEIIAEESQRLTRLINDVLDIAKMEAGKVEWHLSQVALPDLIDRAVAGTAGMIADKPLSVQVELPPDLPKVTADPDRIVQVLTNLLSNAIKFTERGDIWVRAWLLAPGDDILPRGAREPNARTDLPAQVPAIAVSVTDPGIGIQEQDLPQVFDRFRQIGDVVSGRPRGTGLGLPICREIVEHHGGRIWVESTPNVGSRFVFTLPLERPAPAQPTPTAVPAERAEATTTETTFPDLMPLSMARAEEIREHVSTILPPTALPDSARARTILVVDDEPAIRLLLNQELSDAGYRVLEAAEGLTAVEMARTEQPDLILLDVMMPGLSGFDVTSVLKSDERTAHIPILILSIIEDRERGFRLGADEYLTKPVHTEQLLNSIAALLSAPATRRALVVHSDESVIEAITRVLREHGFEVTAAYDPRGAIETAQRIKPNLVILNAMLSQLDDYRVLKALNYTNLSAHADILVLSGKGERTDDKTVV